MRPLSLKGRVILATTVSMVVFLAFVSVAIIKSYQSATKSTIERNLGSDANELISLLEDTQGTGWLPNELVNPSYNQPLSNNIGLIFDQEGKLIWRSLSSYRYEFKFHPVFYNLNRRFYHEKIEGDGFFVYELSVKLALGDTIKDYTLMTMYQDKDYQRDASQFSTIVLLWMTGGLFLMLLVITWTLRWGFKPLRFLAGELSEMKSGDRGQLSHHYPTEIARITRPLNALLHRERESRERLKNTMGDLAHSLKTPLAAIQASAQSLEVLPDVPKDPLADIIEQAQRMNTTITYQLKRAVVGRQGIAQSRIDPKPMAEKLCRALTKVYAAKDVEMELEVEEGCYFDGDEGDLMEVLGNLLENAFRLCVCQVHVKLAFEGDKKQRQHLLLEVDDDGPGVPEDKRESILQRGVRADSRNPGQGIGLAVVADIVASYHGYLTVGRAEGLGGARFAISLPLGNY
ncbi:ATP-binding protein [Gallaecimonas pentaromativorans]|uniref:histidine kinase n=1 Tax=Gallaecimonas pentaromativorans TaxID=584787 RepID=A0A3N1PSN8_9GAMM|nr:ATP-binding protein [Gallaecimonas pentaromativorans]ROQ30131.1 two-component system sensor histidine kinase PhoQ [Gallaecimonas pentaromativorans]